MTDFDLSKYIYWEYSLAVIIITDMVKLLFKKVDWKFIQTIMRDNPKWITLMVAVTLSILDWFIFSTGQAFHFFQFVISFGIAVLGYDYIFKLIKDQFKPGVQNGNG